MWGRRELNPHWLEPKSSASAVGLRPLDAWSAYRLVLGAVAAGEGSVRRGGSG